MMKKWLTWLWRLRSHDLMSANSRSRKASNISSLSLEAWEPGGPTHVVLNPVSQSKGWRMWDEMSQPKEAGRKQTGKISPLPVVLFRHSRGWMMPLPHIIEPTDTNVNLIRKQSHIPIQNLSPPLPHGHDAQN